MGIPDDPQAIPPTKTDQGDKEPAQLLLSEEQRFYSSIIQSAAAPMFVIDRNHTVLFWNNAMAKLTGLSSFQMKGTSQHWKPFYPFKRPLLADLVLDQKQDAIEEYYTDLDLAKCSYGTYCAEGWYDNIGDQRRYLVFEAAPVMNSRNEIIAAIETINDLTEKRLAQEALQSQYSFLQEIMDAIPNPVYYKNTTGAYIGCNKAYLAFLGKSSHEIIGRTVFDIFPEEQARLSVEQDEIPLGRQERISYEALFARYDGQIRNILVTKAPFRNSDGSLGGVIANFLDLTDQRLLDEQVRKMSRAVEQTPASIIITDPAGHIEYVNPSFCRITGFSREEVIGQNPRILKSGRMPAELYAELWQTVSSGKEWRGELHNRRKNGELYWEYATISPLTGKDGQITGFLAVKEDITARKAAEEALVRSQAELKAQHEELGLLFEQVEMAKREWEETLDSLKDFVILTDAEHRVRRCNRLLCDMTGKEFDEVLGNDWRDLLPDAGFICTSFNGTTGELVHDDSQHIYDINIYTMTEQDSGRTSGFVISLNDTTEIRSMTEELKRTSEELREAQAAVFQQEKMASIGQLAAGVAHEINNPMGFISSNLNTLDKYLERFREFISAQDRVLSALAADDALAPTRELRRKLKIDFILDDTKQLISESQDGADRVRRIVQDLKSFSRVDQAEYSLVDINECLETTINIAWNEIKYVARMEREYGQIPPLKCFPQQLNQVFLNLLMNAAQAIEEQGEIRVRTWTEENSVLVSVSDTGSGIPPEVINRIFEPFFTTKEVGKGTGLGLSISYDIIKKHGGVMTVASELGSGSTFTVRLPLDPVPENGKATG